MITELYIQIEDYMKSCEKETVWKITVKHKKVDEAFFSAFLESVNLNEDFSLNMCID